MEALQLGSVQMLAPSLSKFAPLGVKEFEVFDLPFIFDDYNDLHKITGGPVGQGLLKKLESRGITGLAYWDNGFKVMSANKPLKAVEDYKGVKMRIQSSKVLDAEMRALGALPQVLAFSETYQALQTGVVDGTENPPSNLYTQKMHEVQKHVSVTNHGYLGYAVVVNKKFWEGLPADIRGALSKAMTESTKVANDVALQDNKDALEKVRASGKTTIYNPSMAERFLLKKALIPVHKQMASRIGDETIQAIYKETSFDPSKL
jgi:C4-dicarboxylate-binding protein DctP